jgi:uncharacterized membrane protein
MPAFPDWTSILPDSEAPLPLAQDPDFLWSQPSTARGCFIRLADVVPALAARQAPGADAAVYADVLRIEGSLALALTGLTLHARRIEVAADATLQLQSPDPAHPAFRLDVHARDWAFAGTDGRLPLTLGGVHQDWRPAPVGGGLHAQVAADGSVDLRELAAPAAGDPLTGQIVLNAAKRLAQCAGLGPEWSRTLPLQMADWLARTGGDALLRSDAVALAARLRTPRGPQRFVPYLRLSEYGELARSTQTALQAVDQEHRSLFERALGLDDQKQAAEHLLAHYRHAKSFADALLDQAAEDTARASEATELARARLQDRASEIEARQKAFEQGIADKKAELERQAFLGIAMGVLALGAGIAMVCFTGPAGAGVAAGGATKVAEAGAQTARQVNRLVELLKTIAKVLDAIKKIQGYYALLKQAYDVVHDPLQARGRAETAGQHIPPPLDPGDTLGAADWDEFMVGLDAAFRPALDQKIDGADELLLAMKKLAIRGKDMVATQANLDRCQQRLQQCLWQTLRDEADIQDMQARIQAMDQQRGPGTVLMTYTAQLRDRLKFRLVHAIENMADAYAYYALEDAGIQPDVRSSGAELAKLLSDLQQKLLSAKERRGTISDWGPDGLTVQDPGLLQTLQRTGAMSWSVGRENFAGLERIRVSDIRVWLQGDLGSARLHIDIGTSGDYLDRLRGQPFEFMAWPLARAFRYEHDPHGRDQDAWGRPVRVTLKANDAEGDYFEPTAFTTWTIRLPRELNPGVDPARISGVALEFIGTAMGARSRTRGGPTRGRAAAPRTALLSKVITL